MQILMKNQSLHGVFDFGANYDFTKIGFVSKVGFPHPLDTSLSIFETKALYALNRTDNYLLIVNN